MSETNRDQSKILIIDDDPEIRNILYEFLSQFYDCVTSNSAEEALARLAKDRFDLIISDITMERMSGLEMIPLVLEVAPQTVILMISGQQTIEYAIEAMRAGAFDYITKPFDLRQVEAAVRRALKHHHLIEARDRYEDNLEDLVKQRTAEVEHLEYYDVVTDLPNRLHFEDHLRQSLMFAKHADKMRGLLFLALDGFKEINDTLGHVVGDLLLQDLADRLKKCVNEGDTVARFDGDEFAILLTQVTGTKDLVRIARSINEVLKSPFLPEGNEIYLFASIGSSRFPYDGEDSETLLKNTGTALYRARMQTGNNYQCYSADMNATALKRLALETSLRRAVDNDEFVVHYQPQVDFESGNVIGAEALVRWSHPQLGLLQPAEFVRQAEDSGLILPIGAWVLRAACTQARKWQAAGFTSLRIAVNVSPRQFQEEDFMETVMRTLEETSLDPHCLELELTETSVMQHAEPAIRILTQLREVGVTIAIDDFGTGYSSLGYLKHLPIDVVKLDRSFVNGVPGDPDDAALVMAIVTLAHNLRLSVTAEGVESEDQLAFLRLLGCERGQGYLFGKPTPATQVQSLIKRQSGFRMNPVESLPANRSCFIHHPPASRSTARKRLAQR